MKKNTKKYVAIIGVLIAVILYLTIHKKQDEYIEVQQNGIVFSCESGHYNNEIKLKLKSINKGSKIIYTLNGAVPQQGSNYTMVYEKPIVVQKEMVDTSDLTYIPTTIIPKKPNFSTWLKPKKTSVKGVVVRAQVIHENGLKEAPVTKTYFIDGLNPQLPEIYLTMKQSDLFDYNTGIYIPGKHAIKGKKYSGNCFKKGKQWEKPAHMQYLSCKKKVELNQNIGVRIHGLASPAAPMKTLKLYARKKYGSNLFKFNPFPQNDIKSYKRLLLRTPYGTWDKKFFADQLVQKIVKDLNMECAASTPVTVYINGEYWGIHDMAEKIDQHYFESHFGVNKDSLDYAASAYTTEMGRADFKEVYDFAKNNDLSISENYQHITNLIDIENYIDYNVVETYLNNWDWPDNNNEKWKAEGISDKWRWIIMDMDAAFRKRKFKTLESIIDTTHKKLNHRLHSTLLQRKLLQNEEFKSKLITRYEELMSTALCPERLLSIVEEYEELYKNEIERQINRWTIPESMKMYKNKNNDIKIFIQARPKYMIEDIKDQLGVTINPVCK